MNFPLDDAHEEMIRSSAYKEFVTKTALEAYDWDSVPREEPLIWTTQDFTGMVSSINAYILMQRQEGDTHG